jgi:hypothetical protein
MLQSFQVVLLALVTSLLPAQEQKSFKPEIPAVVLERKSAAKRLRVIGKSVNQALTDEDRPHHVEFEFMRYDEFKMIKLRTISRQEADGKPVLSVYGSNTRYAFFITNHGQEQLLVKYLGSDDQTRGIVDGLLFGRHFFDNPLRIGGVLLADYLSFSSVQWRVDPAEDGAMRIVGTGTVPSPLFPKGMFMAADVTVNKRGWIVHQRISGGPGHQVDVTVTYDGERPSSETSVGTGKGIKYLDQLTTYETWDDKASPNEADYSLSAFGLPEPFGIEWEKPTPWWLFLIGGGLGIIVLLAVGYRLRKAGWIGPSGA